MVRKFPTFRSERKKRTTSGGSPQFPNGFSGKLLFHLTFNRNFQIFWLNGKHPRFTTCDVLFSCNMFLIGLFGIGICIALQAALYFLSILPKCSNNIIGKKKFISRASTGKPDF